MHAQINTQEILGNQHYYIRVRLPTSVALRNFIAQPIYAQVPPDDSIFQPKASAVVWPTYTEGAFCLQ